MKRNRNSPAFAFIPKDCANRGCADQAFTGRAQTQSEYLLQVLKEARDSTVSELDILSQSPAWVSRIKLAHREAFEKREKEVEMLFDVVEDAKLTMTSDEYQACCDNYGTYREGSILVRRFTQEFLNTHSK
jgi:hypothetical protein